MLRQIILAMSAFSAGAAFTMALHHPGAAVGVIIAAITLGSALIALSYSRREDRKRRALMIEAVEAMPIPFAIYDEDGRLAASNALYREHHIKAFRARAERGDRRRPTYRELIWDGTDPNLPQEEREAQLEARLAAQPPHDGQLVERRFEDVGWLSVARRTLPGGGAVRVAINVDELKTREAELMAAVERAKASEETREKFLATMTHELRTPLNGVIGMAAILSQTKLSEDQRKHLGMIHNSGMHLLGLINRVLEYSKLHGAEAEAPVPAPFDVVQTLEKVVEEARLSSAAAGLKLRLVRGSGFRRRRIGDRRALARVASNLVGNALKFTEDGEVEARVDETPEGDLLLTVRDTGIGVPPDRVDTIFQPFEQVDASFTRKYGGTGLGLSICAEIVRAQGGEIMVKSALGEGSAFSIRLPFPPDFSEEERAQTNDETIIEIQSPRKALEPGPAGYETTNRIRRSA